MTTTTADKKIKLTDAQRVALRKMYNAHRGAGNSYDRTPKGTEIALHKLGLVDGRLTPPSFRGTSFFISDGLSKTGIELAERLFGMDWWAELLGAFISNQRTKQSNAEKRINSTLIAAHFELETEFELSGSFERGYVGYYDSELVNIRVSKTSFNLRDNAYVIQTKVKAFNLTVGQARLIADLLSDAAFVCHKFAEAQS